MMFANACKKNRESVYGVWAFSKVNDNQQRNDVGSGFTIAPGMLITVGHLVHLEGSPKNKQHDNFKVIRSPDIGQQTEKATLIAEDTEHDIALLRIEKPRSNAFLTLEPNQIPTGTSCGSLGFPLAEVSQIGQKLSFNLKERFQGSFISSYCKNQIWKKDGRSVDYYEVDSLMYKGSSGCPGFLSNSHVIGMQSQSVSTNDPIQGGNHVQHNSVQLSISLWVPSMSIIKFAKKQGIMV